MSWIHFWIGELVCCHILPFFNICTMWSVNDGKCKTHQKHRAGVFYQETLAAGFAGYTGSKNQVWNHLKNFVELDFSNWMFQKSTAGLASIHIDGPHFDPTTNFQSDSMNPELSQLFSQSNCFCHKFGVLVSEDNEFFVLVRICQILRKFEFYKMAKLGRIGCTLSQIWKIKCELFLQKEFQPFV